MEQVERVEEKKKKRIIIIIVLVVFFLLVIIGVLVFLLLRKDAEMASILDSDLPTGYVIDEGNYQQIMEDMQSDVREGYFETYMNTEWTFPDGKSETKNAILGNSPSNTKPIRYEVVLENTDEVVFRTGVIPVGAQLPPFKLEVDLDAGRYDAVCMVYLLDEMEDGTYRDYSSAGFNVTIVVEN